MKEKFKRFKEMVCEIEGISATCPDCGSPLIEPITSDTKGIGDNVVLPMLYCENCNEYIVSWRQRNGNQ